MNDIRRTVLLVVLFMSTFFLWDNWQKHNGQPSFFSPAPAVALPDATKGKGDASLPASPSTATNAAPSAAGAATNAAPAASTDTANTGKTISISTDVVKADFNTVGGTLRRLELLAYVNQDKRPAREILLDNSAERTYWAQSGLLSNNAAEAFPNQTSEMTWVQGPTSMGDAPELRVSFESAEMHGLKLQKTFVFKKGSYAVTVEHKVTNTSGQAIKPYLYVQLLRDGNPAPGGNFFYSTFTGPAVYTSESKYQKIEYKNIEANKASFNSHANDGWVAVVQHYFVSAWLLNDATPREFRMTKAGNNLYASSMVLDMPSIAAGGSATLSPVLYAGPQDENILAAASPGLDYVKDYGWLSMLAKPMYWLLSKLHSYIGNWGWSIVALVLLLKAAFFWLNASAYRSMAKMKAITPKMTAVRETHKDNPQKMQQEMMRLYKEEKVNPIGGCLPIALQMPFFISLYWVLLSTVEMRDAPWVGWITDLSVRDPYFILPLLMAGTSVLQIALNPKPADPMQAKMMWMMPILFSVMFFFFPAGLVLYWLSNNILSISQQWVITRSINGPKKAT